MVRRSITKAPRLGQQYNALASDMSSEANTSIDGFGPTAIVITVTRPRIIISIFRVYIRLRYVTYSGKRCHLPEVQRVGTRMLVLGGGVRARRDEDGRGWAGPQSEEFEMEGGESRLAHVLLQWPLLLRHAFAVSWHVSRLCPPLCIGSIMSLLMC